MLLAMNQNPAHECKVDCTRWMTASPCSFAADRLANHGSRAIAPNHEAECLPLRRAAFEIAQRRRRRFVRDLDRPRWRSG